MQRTEEHFRQREGQRKVLGVSVHTALATVRRYRCEGLK